MFLIGLEGLEETLRIEHLQLLLFQHWLQQRQAVLPKPCGFGLMLREADGCHHADRYR